MLKYILLGLVLLVAVFAIVVSLRPAEFRVSRTATIAAPAPVVFEQVNDLHNWNTWSPWAKMDPNAKVTFEGPQAGEGAAFGWAGNSKVGEGKMTIVESKPGELVRYRLEFLKPFAATNTADFTLRPQGGQTAVTWAMYGRNNFISKAMSLVMDCDKMIGGEFEKGLRDMKSIAETNAGKK
jgi:hypothetical protein